MVELDVYDWNGVPVDTRSQRVIPRSLAVAQKPNASPRHNLDTVWLRRHSEDDKLVSFFSPVAILRLKSEEGRGL